MLLPETWPSRRVCRIPWKGLGPASRDYRLIWSTRASSYPPKASLANRATLRVPNWQSRKTKAHFHQKAVQHKAYLWQPRRSFQKPIPAETRGPKKFKWKEKVPEERQSEHKWHWKPKVDEAGVARHDEVSYGFGKPLKYNWERQRKSKQIR